MRTHARTAIGSTTFLLPPDGAASTRCRPALQSAEQARTCGEDPGLPTDGLRGLRPKPKRNRRALVRANGHSGNGAPEGQNHGGNGQDLVIAIEAMEHKIGKRLYRGLLKRVARVWTPQQIRETAVLEQVLAQMRGAERGLARLEAAQARLTPETVQGTISSLNLPPAKLENLQTLHTLVVALEQAVESKDLSCLPPGK